MNKPKILVDLKPALDGYAGIPQESRLLFMELLRSSDEVETHGLLQHGGDWLKTHSRGLGDLPVQQRIARNSETVVSFYGPKAGRSLKGAKTALQNYAKLTGLRLQTLLNTPLTLGEFEGQYFKDFLWSRLFQKTLRAADQPVVGKAAYRVLAPSRKAMHQTGLTSKRLNTRFPYPRLDTRGYDYLIAQTPFPGRVSQGTQLIVRYHDAVPVLMPHTIGDKHFHQASHYWALRQNVDDGAWLACISEATRQDLLTLFPEAESNSFVIHNTVSNSFHADKGDKALILTTLLDRAYRSASFTPQQDEIAHRVEQRNASNLDYLLMVSTLEPRKNHLTLLAAWDQLKESGHPNLKLILVGNPGWDYAPLLDAMRPWAERGQLIYLQNVPIGELNRLYQHARVTVCPSLAEGFDYSGVEAMRCGSPVVASDIAVHREIYADAAHYFNPHDANHAAEVIHTALSLDKHALEHKLSEGKAIGSRYSMENLMPQWHQALQPGYLEKRRHQFMTESSTDSSTKVMTESKQDATTDATHGATKESTQESTDNNSSPRSNSSRGTAASINLPIHTDAHGSHSVQPTGAKQ